MFKKKCVWQNLSKMLTRHQFIFNNSSYQKISLLAGPNLCSSDEIENGLQNSCNESHDSPWRPEMVLKGSSHPSIHSLVVVFLNRSFHIFINFCPLPMTIPRDHPKWMVKIHIFVSLLPWCYSTFTCQRFI